MGNEHPHSMTKRWSLLAWAGFLRFSRVLRGLVMSGFCDSLPFWQARFDVLSLANAGDRAFPCHFDRFGFAPAFVCQFKNI